MGRFLGVVGGLVLFYLCGMLMPSDAEDWQKVINTAGPVATLLASLWTAYSLVSANPWLLWTPLPWFVTVSGLYFGLGPLTYTLGDEALVADMGRLYRVSGEELLRTNLLNAVGMFLITASFLASWRLAERYGGRPSVTRTSPLGDVRAEVAVYVFLGIGLPLEYLLLLPSAFGSLGFVVPGVIANLSCLVSLGIFMLSYLAARAGGRWRVLFWALLSAELVVEFLCFNKSAFLMVLVMATLGRYLARRRMKELVLGAAITFGVYVLLVPLVAWGREQILLEHGNSVQAPLSERLAIVGRAFELASRGQLEFERKGGWWARLSYANAQALAMDLFDRGRAGDTFGLAVYGLVPRFLWPDKPVIEPGLDFTEMALGHRGSHTGIGVFGEAYWNGGWLFVVLACCYIGILYTWLSRTALGMLARSEWLMLPCAFLGIMLGARIDDWFAPAFFSGMLIYLAYYLCIRAVLGRGRSGEASPLRPQGP
jgi:hypothetical protein